MASNDMARFIVIWVLISELKGTFKCSGPHWRFMVESIAW